MSSRHEQWRDRYGDIIDRISADDLDAAIRRGSAISSAAQLDARGEEIRQTRECLTLAAYDRH